MEGSTVAAEGMTVAVAGEGVVGVPGNVLVAERDEGVAVDASVAMDIGGAGTGVKRGCELDVMTWSQWVNSGVGATPYV